MHKNFEGWNIEKQKLHNYEKDIPFFSEREIWWCSLGINIGHEQDGKNYNFERPVLVFKKFSKYLLWALPLSSKIKNNSHCLTICYKGDLRSILLSQLRLVSSKRLLRRIHILSPEEGREVKDRLLKLFP